MAVGLGLGVLGLGTVLACNNLIPVSNSGGSTDGSCASYITISPACTTCSSDELQGYNEDCEHGSNYTATVTQYQNGQLVGGRCTGGDPTVTFGTPCYTTITAPGCNG